MKDPKVLEAFEKVALEAFKKECSKADQEGWSQLDWPVAAT